MNDFEKIIQLRSLINDFVVVAQYKSDHTWHSEREVYIRLKNEIKESIVSKLNDAMLNNDIITETLDEIYQSKVNTRVVLLEQLKKGLKDAEEMVKLLDKEILND